MTVPAQAGAGSPHILVIHNPVAGRRRRKRFWQALELLEREGCKLTLHLTEAPGDAIEFARRIQPGEADLVIAAGGDGTINEVINGLVAGARPAPAPLAILPLGTSNVLAVEIGLGKSAAAVVRTIRERATCRVSLGRIDQARISQGRSVAGKAKSRFFVLMAGAGIDAHAVAAVDADLKRRFAQGAYIWAGLRAVLRSRDLRYRVDVDGVRHEAASVIVAKASRYGGPFVLAKRARLDDPRFEVCLFQRAGFWPVALFGLAAVAGRLDLAPGFSSVLGKKVRITAVDPAAKSGAKSGAKSAAKSSAEPVQCDGDDLARLPAAIEVVPDALELVVPSDGPYGAGGG